MLTERIFAFEELTLNCAAGPAPGPPLLLLHGVSRRWQDFQTLIPALSMRWRVHALDFRGHGRSGRGTGQYRVADYVRDVERFLRAQFSEPVVILGHSLGGLVAAALAARMPELVRALVLEDMPSADFLQRLSETPYHALFTGMRTLAGPGHSVQAVARALAELRLPGADGPGSVRLGDVRDPAALRFSARCLQDLDPAVLTPLVEGGWLDGYDQEDVARRVLCPALLLRGDETLGGMLPRSAAEHLAGLMAESIQIDLPGVGHLIHWLEPAATARLVVGFLESL